MALGATARKAIAVPEGGYVLVRVKRKYRDVCRVVDKQWTPAGVYLDVACRATGQRRIRHTDIVFASRSRRR